MIPTEVIRSLRDSIDIVGVAEASGLELRQAGRDEWKGLCPFHAEKTPSFTISANKRLFYCFGCGKGGDAIKLYQELHGCDFPKAVEELAVKVGLSIQVDRRSTAEEEAVRFFRQNLEGSEAERFLKDRLVPPQLVDSFHLGYAPQDPSQISGFLRENYSPQELAGLYSRKGRFLFRHRLMIPIMNEGGRVVGMAGRSLNGQEPKYLNSQSASSFKTGDHLYGLYQARRAVRDSGHLVLVEGFFDVWASVAIGRAAIAQMGGSLSVRQISLLSRYTRQVTIAMDGDAAGRRAFLKSLPRLLRAGLFVRAALLPGSHDPDSLRQAEGDKALLALLDNAPDAVELEIQRLASGSSDAFGHQQALESVKHLLAWIPRRQEAARLRYVEIASDAFRLPQHHFLPPKPRKARTQARPLEEEALLYSIVDGHRIEGIEARHFKDRQCRRIFRILDCSAEGHPLEKALSSLGAGDMGRLSRIIVAPSSTAAYATARDLKRLAAFIVDRP